MHLSLTAIPHLLHRLFRIDRRSPELRTQPVTLSRQRIYILPTRYGVLFGALVFVMLIGATNYVNSMGFLLTFLLAGLAMVSILHTYRNLARLSLRPGRAARGFCGEPARYTVYLDNPKGPARAAVALSMGGQPPVDTDIAPRSTAGVELGRPTRRRGYVPMGVITVSTSYPAGLFRAWSRIRLDLQCLVYPRPAGTAAPTSGSPSTAGSLARQRSGNDDFLGFRDYQITDSPRHVDWKAVARGQQMVTKLFAHQEADSLWLDWHRLAGLDTETRLERLCRAVLEAEAAGHRYGLRLPGREIEINRGDAHKHRCLEALALFEGP